MKKFYLTMILGLSLCAVLAIAAPKGAGMQVRKAVSPEKVLTEATMMKSQIVADNLSATKAIKKAGKPAKAAPASVEALTGTYELYYNDALNGGTTTDEVTISISDLSTNEVTIDGVFGSFEITATYDPATGALTCPYQVLGYNSNYMENMVFTSCDYVEENSTNIAPTKDPVVFGCYENEETGEPFFYTPQTYCVVGETAEGFTHEEGWYALANQGILTKLASEAEWAEVGTAEFLDGGFFAPIFGKAIAPVTVKVQQSPENENIFRLVGPWNEAFGRNLGSYLVFDVTHKDCVVIPECATGVTETNLGKATVFDIAGMYIGSGLFTYEEFMEIAAEEEIELVTMTGNTINMPIGSVVTEFANDNGWYILDEEMGAVPSYIKLDADVMALIDGPAEVEAITIAEAIALGNANQEGKEAVIDVTGAKVTFVNEDNGTSFMENEDGAIAVQSEEALFTQGTELTGNISGIVYPGQNVMAEKADVTTAVADVTYGTEMTVGQASKPSNNYRLATINIDENVTVAEGNNGITLTSDEFTVEVVDMWDIDLDFNTTDLTSVTGILVYQEGVMGANDEPEVVGHMFLCPRSQADIETAIETITLADAIAISKTIEDEGQEARIDVTGVVVNYVDEWGMFTYVENEDGAMEFDWYDFETACPFEEGTELTGYVDVIIGSLQRAEVVGYKFTTEEVDVTYGSTFTVSQATNPANMYRLATFRADDNTQIVVDEENWGLLVVQGEDVLAVTDVVDGGIDFDIDGKILSVTGLLFDFSGMMYGDNPVPTSATILSPRRQDDIRTLNTLTIGDAKHLRMMEEAYINFTDAKVTFVKDNSAFIEDETGAIQLILQGSFDFERSDAISGQIHGYWTGEAFYTLMAESNIEVTGTADVKYGKPLQFTNDMSKYVDYLVTIEATDATPMVWNEEVGAVEIGTSGDVFTIDFFETMSPTYNWENKIYKKITGIVINMQGMYIVAPRDADDIDASTGINTLGAENEFKAYSIDGMAQPATSADQLRKGLYIINGKKVIIKK